MYQAGPTIEPARPAAYWSYGFGCASSVVLLARETELKKFLYAVRPAIDLGVSRAPFHLPLTRVAMFPPKSNTKLIAEYQSVPAMYSPEKPFCLFTLFSFAPSAASCARLFGAFSPAFFQRSVRYVTTREPA